MVQPESRIPGFYKYSVEERLRVLLERQVIAESDFHMMMDNRQVLEPEQADQLVENVIGVFSLPFGLGLNFIVNGRDYIVPLVVEEPSILAGVSNAAKIVRSTGGFRADSRDSLLIGQIPIINVADSGKARDKILSHTKRILQAANAIHPRMLARKGGAKEIEVLIHPRTQGPGDMLVVHLLVDTCDAMGANLVNSMCEGVAPMIEELSGGKAILKILSNLTDRSMVTADAVIPISQLETPSFSGASVRDGIILAAEFAALDPYRAATHNKGIMNGIDALAIATGNDWRAIEAAAHAYAGRGYSYTSLSRWTQNEQGDLVGHLEVPLKVGIVGGNMQSNPAVRIAHHMMNISSARELAALMGAVGLAQNLAALRALSTSGIQRGHMNLHARSVAVAAGAPRDVFENVVKDLVSSGDIKVWKAQQIVAQYQSGETPNAMSPSQTKAQPKHIEAHGAGHGKVILLGEHAVVYGARAIAAPIPLAIQARVEERKSGGIVLQIPRWKSEITLDDTDANNGLAAMLHLILGALKIRDRHMIIELYPHVPRAMGLGSSAAMAVAMIRALNRQFDGGLDDAAVNKIAFSCEELAHGTPSGIDNTLATYGAMIAFQRGDPPTMDPIHITQPLPIVLGITGIEGSTLKTVARVRAAHELRPQLYDRIFSDIDRLTEEGRQSIETNDLEHLGCVMNICQGLLNALQVSSPELEQLIDIARNNGALGAKLTGGGGGGSMVALAPPDEGKTSDRIAAAMRQAGFQSMITTLG